MPQKTVPRKPLKKAEKKAAKPPAKITLRELATRQAWQAMFQLIRQLNKHMTRKQYDTLLAEMLARGYRCVGAYQGSRLVGVAGFWVGYRFWCRKYIDIDNVVVDESVRSRGVGAEMIAWIEAEGRRQDCEMAMLDCYTTHHESHRFYFRQRYSILGYHFTKDL